MTTAHANCSHSATKADRAACRKAKAEGKTLFYEVTDFAGRSYGTYLDKAGAQAYIDSHNLIRPSLTKVAR